jgi:hypothetical protein
MPFIGKQPAEAALVTGDLGDDIVTLAKMAAGTDGQIITYDASGNPSAVGPGSDGQVLTSTGAGSPPAFEAVSAGWEFVQSVTASTSSTIDLGEGNLAAGYNYQIDCIQVDNSADLTEANCPRLQFGTSTGPTYQTSGYTSQMWNFSATAEVGSRDATTAGVIVICFGNIGGATAGETWDATINIPNPAAATEHRVLTYGCGHNSAGAETIYGAGGHRTTAETVTGLRILPGSGTFISGTFVLSRRKIA